MLTCKARKFTFRCESCKKIMVSEFDDEQDIEDIVSGLLWLECDECSGKSPLLTD